MNLVYKYRRMVGRGMEQWDTDSGVTHASEYPGSTLCGRRIGSIKNGWEVSSWGYRESSVSCGHCLKQIATRQGAR